MSKEREQDRRQRPRWVTRLADIAMTCAGLMMAITPLTLWISPEKEILLFWLGVCAASGLIVIVLARSGLTDKAGPSRDAEASERPYLPEQMIARWQNFGHLSRREGEEVREFVRGRLAVRHGPDGGASVRAESGETPIRFL